MRRGIVLIPAHYVVKNIHGLTDAQNEPVEVICDCELFEEHSGGPLPRYQLTVADYPNVEGHALVTGAEKVAI